MVGVYYDGHNGYDWALPGNTPILAAASGKVVKITPEKDDPIYGWTVTIDHLNGYQTMYSHLRANASLPAKDSCVEAGDVIGVQGSTGNSTGDHLHFRVLHDGRITDPFGWCYYCAGASPDPLKDFNGEESQNLWFGVTPKSIVQTETGFVYRQATVPDISLDWTAFRTEYLGGPGIFPPSTKTDTPWQNPNCYVNSAAPSPEIGFQASTDTGQTVALSDFQGHVVLVHFWSTWAGFPYEDMASLQALYEELSSECFALLAVNLGEPLDVVSAFRAETGLTFPIVMDEHEELAGLFAVSVYPSSYLVNEGGEIVETYYGPLTSQQFQEIRVAVTK
ncbi:MAG: peptidoglycan DD-metalloendopeptidase family protein, partial [Candidatus Hydrogenedentes bacterium]|nr:peptidoglycan DD-metalloendopeptidase family protein [Candidatus Hydrogenedentota bacterium]